MNDGSPAKRDFFVSFNKADREWATWIAWELEEAGYSVVFQDWDFRGNFVEQMDCAQRRAERTLAVISDHYFGSDFTLAEWTARFTQDAAGRKDLLVPVKVGSVNESGILRPNIYADLTGCDEGVARDRLLERVKKALDPNYRTKPKNRPGFPGVQAAAPARQVRQKPDFPSPATAISNIPIRLPRYFMGRDDALAAVEEALQRHEGRVAVTALHGLRGVGKTTLAAAFAEHKRETYHTTWWIRAQTEPGLRADLVALGVRLGWVGADDKEEPALAATLERLRYEGEGVLLIYDNALSARGLLPYLPRGGASHILVTSNAPDWRGLAEPVPLDVWPVAVGADYLLTRTGCTSERAPAEALAGALGGLPLAHEQAAAYCERLGVSLVEYQRRFEATPARLLDAQTDAPAEYGLTVAKTFALAIAEANNRHPAAEPLIAYAALLAPEPIPLFLFSEGREKLGEPLASALAEDGLDEAVAALRAFALVEREAVQDERDATMVTECVRLHRLVRQVAARTVGEVREDLWRALVAALREVYPEDVNDDPGIWPRARRLDALALDLVSREAKPLSGAEMQTAWLLDRLASYRQAALAAYTQARPLYEKALATREKVLGPDHPDTAISLSNLALLLAAQGDHAAARPLFERALATREKALGPDHPITAHSLNNLAGLLTERGDYAAARPLFERTLATREKVLGPDHPDTAISLNNLASLLDDQGDYAAARPLFERALATREKVLGPDHPNTSSSLNNLAYLLWKQGDYATARPLHERALAIREKVLGPDHPDTAISLNNLARLLADQGDYAAARPLHERALVIWEATLGPDHPITAHSLNNLARLLADQGDYATARSLFERALAIREKVLGPDHPKTAESFNNLASLLERQSDRTAGPP